jgi:hypothetical protein
MSQYSWKLCLFLSFFFIAIWNLEKSSLRSMISSTVRLEFFVWHFSYLRIFGFSYWVVMTFSRSDTILLFLNFICF